MQSCIYEGETEHYRYRPVSHRFRYRLFLLMIDLDETNELKERGLLRIGKGFAPATFSPADYLGAAADSSPTDLQHRVRTIVQQQTGRTADGPIRMLCQLRYWGYYFSPLNLYYCYASDGTTLEFVVAEVSNIPWREKHCYVLWDGNGQSTDDPAVHKYRNAKQFHVSPFMPMNQQYRWELEAPGAELKVRLENWDDARGPFGSTPLGTQDSTTDFSKTFDAKLHLYRKELTWGRLQRNVLAHGWMSGKVVAAIYYEALKLWLKKSPYYPHPASLTTLPSTMP